MSSDFIEWIFDFLPASRILHHEGWILHLRCGTGCADCWSDGARIRNTEYDDVEGLVADRRG